MKADARSKSRLSCFPKTLMSDGQSWKKRRESGGGLEKKRNAKAEV